MARTTGRNTNRIGRSLNNFVKIIIQLFEVFPNFLARIKSLHGSFHFQRLNRTLFERFLWWIIVLLAASGAIYVTTVFFRRHINRPMVISIQRDYMTWNTTFPTFTLCSKQRMNETALKIFLSQQRLSTNETENLETFLRSLVDLTMFNLFSLIEYEKFDSNDYLSVVDKLTNNYNYDILYDSLPAFKFQRTVTELGICDTFNSQLSPYLHPKYLMGHKIPAKEEVFEINYFDMNTFILVNNLADSDIYFHGPYDLPQFLPYTDIGGNFSIFKSMDLAATTIRSDPKVRSLFKFHRKCRYFDESDLEHFPHMFSNDFCKLNCKLNMMLKKCGCLPFFYKNHDNFKYCSSLEMMCIEYYKYFLTEANENCICPRTCEDTKFSVHESKSLIWLRGNTLRLNLLKPKLRFSREVLHSLTDLIVATGATCCLFLGISVLTIIEFFYYLCIKPKIQFVKGKRHHV